MKRRPIHIDVCAVSALTVFFVWACLHLSGEIFNIDLDNTCKAFYSRYLFSLLPLPGAERIAPPLLIDSEVRGLPLMFMPHVGSAFMFLSVPVELVFRLLRLPYGPEIYLSAVGLAAALCVFYCARRLFGPTAALLVFFFLCVNQTFVRTVREGFVREEIFQVLGLWAGAACVLKAMDGRRRGWTLAAFFIFGFTLWGKVMFLGYIFGALFGASLVPGGRGRKTLREILFPTAAAAAGNIAAFAAGALPLVWFNCTHNFPTLGRIWNALLRPTGHGVAGEGTWNNLDIPGNLATRAGNILDYLRGSIYNDALTSDFPSFFAALFVCALVWAVFTIARRDKDRKLGDALVFLLGGYAMLVLLSCVVLNDYWPGHILITVPFCELICALFVAQALKSLRGRAARTAILVLALAFWSVEQGARFRFYFGAIESRAMLIQYKDEVEIMLDAVKDSARPLVCHENIGWSIKALNPRLPVVIINSAGPLADYVKANSGGNLRLLVCRDTFNSDYMEQLEQNGVYADSERNFNFRGENTLSWNLCRLSAADTKRENG